MLYFVASEKPYETAAGLATVLAGVPVYWISRKRSR
jgi:hypothetical protein